MSFRSFLQFWLFNFLSLLFGYTFYFILHFFHKLKVNTNTNVKERETSNKNNTNGGRKGGGSATDAIVCLLCRPFPPFFLHFLLPPLYFHFSPVSHHPSSIKIIKIQNKSTKKKVQKKFMRNRVYSPFIFLQRRKLFF